MSDEAISSFSPTQGVTNRLGRNQKANHSPLAENHTTETPKVASRVSAIFRCAYSKLLSPPRSTRPYEAPSRT